MNVIFHDMIGKNMKIYIDDIVIKSKSKKRYLEDLRASLESMRTYKIKMNPLKCAFGVLVQNFMGFQDPSASMRNRGQPK